MTIMDFPIGCIDLLLSFCTIQRNFDAFGLFIGWFIVIEALNFLFNAKLCIELMNQCMCVCVAHLS